MVLLVLFWVVWMNGVRHVGGDEEGLPDRPPQHLVTGVEAAKDPGERLPHHGAPGALGGLGAYLLVVEADEHRDPGVLDAGVSIWQCSEMNRIEKGVLSIKWLMIFKATFCSKRLLSINFSK